MDFNLICMLQIDNCVQSPQKLILHKLQIDCASKNVYKMQVQIKKEIFIQNYKFCMSTSKTIC